MSDGDESRSRLIERIPADDWSALAASGIRVHFRSGQDLFRQGDAGRHVYVLLDGRVKIVRSEAEGGQTMLTLRVAGDVVGDMAALDFGTRSATVTALGPVKAQMLTAEQFRRFLLRPGVSGGFTRYTVERLRQADMQRTEIAVLPVRTRLARTLLRLIDQSADGVNGRVVVLAQQDIARHAGASRNAAVEILTELREAGIIATRRGATTVLDVGALRRMANF